jgi:hypothetical protein
MSPQYGDFFYKSLLKWNFNFRDCSYFIASDPCLNWPLDFNISALKNKCLDAACSVDADWLILLPGADCSLMSMPNFRNLDENVIYGGFLKEKYGEKPKICSLHAYSKKIYKKYRYDEFFRFYWDDFDFFHNQTKDVPKKIAEDLICFHQTHGRLTENEYIGDRFQIEKTAFLKKYNAVHGIDFVV